MEGDGERGSPKRLSGAGRALCGPQDCIDRRSYRLLV